MTETSRICPAQHRRVMTAVRSWLGTAATQTLVTTALPATPTPWAQSLLMSWLDHAYQPAVVRLIDSTLLPIDARAAEMAAATHAAAAGVGPAIYFQDPDRGVLIMQWIEPQNRSGSVGVVVDLLADWHRYGAAVGVDLERRKTAAALADIDAATSNGLVPQCFRWAADTYRVLSAFRPSEIPATVLCHNDLNPTNRIFSNGRWWLIDFDYVGQADPLFDLATMLLGMHRNWPESTALLDRYLGRAASRNECDRLAFHRVASLLRYGFTTASLVPPHMSWAGSAEARAFEFDGRSVGRLAVGFLNAANAELRAPYVADAFDRLGLAVPDTIDLGAAGNSDE